MPRSPGKRSSRTIQWDEDTIAEHDKERGTRQKIDEPPTPYRYNSSSDKSDSGESGCEGDDSFHSAGDSSEKMPPGSVASTFSSPSSRSKMTHPAPQQDSRATLDWSTLHAKLHYERQLQRDASEHDPHAGSDDLDSLGGLGLGQGLDIWDGGLAAEGSGQGLDEAREKHVFCLENRIDEEAAETDPVMVKEFKDKRNAHYNEFKVIQAMRKRREAQEKARAASASGAHNAMQTSDDDGDDDGDDWDDEDDEDEDGMNVGNGNGGLGGRKGHKNGGCGNADTHGKMATENDTMR